MSIRALLVIATPLLIAGETLPAGTVFAELTFPDQTKADFFKQKLNWSAMRVEVGSGTNPRLNLLVLEHIPQAAPHAEKLALVEILTLGELAAVAPRALQDVIGTADAGPLIRAAKRVLAGGSAAEPRRPAALPIELGDDANGGDVINMDKVLADADRAPASDVPPAIPKAPAKPKAPTKKKA